MAKKIITDEYVFKGRVHFQNYTKFRRAPIYGELESLQPKQGEWYKYATEWLLNEMGGAGVADWTNVHLGNDPTDPTDNLTHGLGAPISDLLVKVLISTDGTDANSFEVGISDYTDQTSGVMFIGWTVYQVDNNNIKIQTGSQGLTIRAIDATGAGDAINTENWSYKIKVWKLG